MSVKTYDPKKIKVIFAGRNITGFSEDSIVEIEPLGEGITSVVGADGEVARSLDPDTRCRVTVTLMATSGSNTALSVLHAADRTTGKGALPILVKDLTGATLLAAPQAWVVNHPKKEYGKTIGDVEWVIETGPAAYFVGGSK